MSGNTEGGPADPLGEETTGRPDVGEGSNGATGPTEPSRGPLRIPGRVRHRWGAAVAAGSEQTRRGPPGGRPQDPSVRTESRWVRGFHPAQCCLLQAAARRRASPTNRGFSSGSSLIGFRSIGERYGVKAKGLVSCRENRREDLDLPSIQRVRDPTRMQPIDENTPGAVEVTTWHLEITEPALIPAPTPLDSTPRSSSPSG